MAITDNNFTPEELGAAITAKPELLAHVTGYLTGNKYVVQDEAAHAAFLTNHEAVIAGRVTSKHAADLEKDVLEMTGVPKDPNEKYYDYFKRAVPASLQSVTTLKEELATLKTKGGGTDADKARIKELETAIEASKTEFTTKLTEKEKEILAVQTETAVSSALAEYRAKYKKTIPDSLIKLAENDFTRDLMARAKRDVMEGKPVLVFTGDDGQIVMDKTTMKPAGVKYMIDQAGHFKDMIDTQKGAGSGTDPKNPGAGGQGGGEGSKYTGRPSDVTTRVGLSDYLFKLGITDDSEEYGKIMTEPDNAKLPLR